MDRKALWLQRGQQEHSCGTISNRPGMQARPACSMHVGSRRYSHYAGCLDFTKQTYLLQTTVLIEAIQPFVELRRFPQALRLTVNRDASSMWRRQVIPVHTSLILLGSTEHVRVACKIMCTHSSCLKNYQMWVSGKTLMSNFQRKLVLCDKGF